jgi:hypothetical protein
VSDFKIQEYTWSQVHDRVEKADPEFTKVVDDWDPGKEYTFIELSYPFGSHILDVNKGGFQLPKENGRTVPLKDSSVPTELRKKLGYNALPLGILMPDHGIEVYHKLEDRVFSLAFFTSGFNIGIWETFGPPAPYSAIAGSRSMIMAPKITDTDNHKKLKDCYGIRQAVPRNLFDQSAIFVELAKHLKEPWEVKILFLNHKWLEPQKRNIGWLNFYNYLRDKSWQHTEYARSKSVFEVSWKHFCEALKEKGERFDPYLIETLRHIIFVSQGTLPAFAAVGKNEMHGPTQFLMDVYANKYGLKNYTPTLLAPIHLGRTFKEPVPLYYSFQNPTLLDSIPKIKTFSSAIDDMRNFKALMECFIEETAENSFNFGVTTPQEMLSQIKFDYFHSEMHTYGGIESSDLLPLDDPNLLYMPGENNGKQFASKGSFFRCCLRIMPNR